MGLLVYTRVSIWECMLVPLLLAYIINCDTSHMKTDMINESEEQLMMTSTALVNICLVPYLESDYEHRSPVEVGDEGHFEEEEREGRGNGGREALR